MSGEIAKYVSDLLENRKLLPSQLAKQIGVSHPTVGRWLTGEDRPKPEGCIALSNYSGTPILELFKMAGHLPEDFDLESENQLPDFWEYMRRKYPHVPQPFIGAIWPLLNEKNIWAK